MRRLQNPLLWLPVGLLLLAVVGTLALWLPDAVDLTERERWSYGLLPVWRAGFDALSATTGAGLLTRDFGTDYTALGRVVLVTLGVMGATLYLFAVRQVLQHLTGGRLPSKRALWVALLVGEVLALSIGVGLALSDVDDIPPTSAALTATSAFFSLGWQCDHPRPWFAAIALLATVTLPWWLLASRGAVRGRHLLVATTTYLAFLLGCAGLFAILEAPRGIRPSPVDRDAVAQESPPGRVARGVVQVVAAAGAGISTEPVGRRDAREGTRLVLALVVVVGGLGGHAGGGITWLLLIATLPPVAQRLRHQAGGGVPAPWPAAGTMIVGGMVTLVLVVTIGILVIENQVATPYQPEPTLGEALLTAASAVAGANLASDVLETLCSANLSSGMQQTVDQYQYGMTWLMLAMLAGRALPIVVLARLAGARQDVAAPPAATTD